MRYYATVGYQENLGQFFTILEWLFPDVFKGATEAHKKMSKTIYDIIIRMKMFV